MSARSAWFRWFHKTAPNRSEIASVVPRAYDALSAPGDGLLDPPSLNGSVELALAAPPHDVAIPYPDATELPTHIGGMPVTSPAGVRVGVHPTEFAG